MSEHHYYGSSAFDWVVGDTKEEVIKKLARMAGSSSIQNQVKHNGGLYICVCRVELPQAAHYEINYYMPSTITKEDGVNETRKGERVPLSEVEHLRIVTVKGRTVPYEKKDAQTA